MSKRGEMIKAVKEAAPIAARQSQTDEGIEMGVMFIRYSLYGTLTLRGWSHVGFSC